jgi:hypothetical protein
MQTCYYFPPMTAPEKPAHSVIAPQSKALTPEQQAQLADPEKQKEYERQMREQLRRLQCPGCGESELF